jgi:hypothetical protein
LWWKTASANPVLHLGTEDITDISADKGAIHDETHCQSRHVSLGEWLPAEEAGEVQAKILVNSEQFTEVLNRLALSAAVLFYDRYRKPVDRDDVDWDTLEYANDFRRALDYCGLDWNDVDRNASKAEYLRTMHTETRRLAEATEFPLVEPETD